MAIHNNAKMGDIAKTVLMPGDPLRAKMIAETYLDDYRLVNDVRGILAFTGKYKGKEITVMASGMGMPSMGIYSYELYKFYGVENIIRIGSCGAYREELNLLDVVLVENSYNEGNFAKNYTGEECHFVGASTVLNEAVEKTAEAIQQKIVKCNIATTEVFDPYLPDPLDFAKRVPKEYNILGSEMESFALFFVAKLLNKNATCLLTVADSNCKKENLSSEQRLNALTDMIKLALETAVNL